MSIYNIKNFVDRSEEILNLLNQLTDSQVFDENRFINIIYSLNDNHNIFVYLEDNKIVGIITLLIEQKLIRNGACVAHIEDLVVDKNYLNRGIAKKLINFCFEKISCLNCYKTILNCSKELKCFYEKFGFKEKNIQMAKYYN